MSRRARPGRAFGGRAWRARGAMESLLAGLLHGLLMVLAFPGVGLWPLALVAGAPLLMLSERIARDPGRSALAAGLFAGLGTLPMWIFEHSWVASMTAAGLAPLGLLLSVYPGLIVWGVARVRRRFERVPLWVAAGVVWGGVEFLRGSIVLDGYPWLLLGHPLIESALLALPARWIGAYGVSAMAAMVAGCVGTIVQLVIGRNGATPRSVRVGVLVGIGSLAVAWIASAMVEGGRGEGSGRVVVGLVQTNLPQSVRGEWTGEDRVASMRELIELSERAGEMIGGRGAAFIAWPETMYPGYFLDPESLRVVRDLGEGASNLRDFVIGMEGAMRALVERVGVPIIVGVSAYEGLAIENGEDGLRWDGARRFNSAIVVRKDGFGERYDKLFLTPFGEVMPYISRWRALERLLASVGGHGMAFDLERGSRANRLVVARVGGDDVLAATPICFEATVPSVVRRLVFEDGRRRAGLILNITNDGWFGDSDRGRELHLLGARWRCVELETAMARAANTGITCIVDARGRVTARIPSHEAGVLVQDVELGRRGTVYGTVGDLFGWLTLCGAVLLVGGTYFGGTHAGNADGVGRGERDEDEAEF